jgi:hypothetical protein
MAINFKGFDSAGSITGGLVYKGSYNATTASPDLTTAQKGDFYIVSVAGTLAGVTLNVGDHIVFNQNASSPITSSMFDVIDNTDAVQSVNTQTGVVVLDTDDISETATNQYQLMMYLKDHPIYIIQMLVLILSLELKQLIILLKDHLIYIIQIQGLMEELELLI